MKTQTIKKINQSPCKAYFAITGGGQSFLGEYMKVSGASNTVIGAIIPYSQYAFDKFVNNSKTVSYASETAARKLAVVAYNECIAAGVEDIYAIGIGASCSLVKDDERSGREHKIYVAAHTADTTYVLNTYLQQGRTRQEEEYIASELIGELLARVSIGELFSPTTYFTSPQEYRQLRAETSLPIATLLRGSLDNVMLKGKGLSKDSTVAIYCGSWNPWHKGHQEVFNTAKKVLNTRPILELSVKNVDKGQIDFIDIEERLNSIPSGIDIVATCLPTFVEKAEMFRRHCFEKDIVFIVGADTWNRIWDNKYLGHPNYVDARLKYSKVKFLVFPRPGVEIQTTYGKDLRITSDLIRDFSPIAISSTDLRI